jgi:uncharacterized protein
MAAEQDNAAVVRRFWDLVWNNGELPAIEELVDDDFTNFGIRRPGGHAAVALHERHAPTSEALELVYTHCLIVCGIAEQLHASSGLDADIDLVRAGCLLHDVGVYRLYDDAGELDHANYVRHGLLGHEVLREEGFPEVICRFASCHTGVGLSRDDVLRQGLPLPPGDYLAETVEEALVMYADKFHTKTRPPALLTAGAYAASVRRFGEDKVAAFEAMRAAFGEPDLTPFSSAYGHRVTAGT